MSHIPFQSTKGFKGFLTLGDGLEKDGQGKMKVKAGSGLSFSSGKLQVIPHAVLVVANDASQWYKDRASHQCDGTDDEVQIQSALDEAGTVYLSDGTFNVKEVRMNSHNRLIGSGKENTILKQKANSNSSGDTFVLGNKGAQYSTTILAESSWDENIYISDLKVEPNRLNQDLSAGRDKVAGLFFYGCKYIYIERVWTNTGIGTQDRLPTRATNFTSHHGVDYVYCNDSIFEFHMGWTHNCVAMYDGSRHFHFERCDWLYYDDDQSVAVDFVHGNSHFNVGIQLADDKGQGRLSYDMKINECRFINAGNVAQFAKTNHGIVIHGSDNPGTDPVGLGSCFTNNLFFRIGHGIKMLESMNSVTVSHNTLYELRQSGIFTTLGERGGKVELNICNNIFLNHRGNADATFNSDNENFGEMYFERLSACNITGNISRVTEVGFNNTNSIPNQTGKPAFLTLIGCITCNVSNNNFEDSKNDRHMIFIRNLTSGEDNYSRVSDNLIMTNNIFLGHSSYNIIQDRDTMTNKVDTNNLKMDV